MSLTKTPQHSYSSSVHFAIWLHSPWGQRPCLLPSPFSAQGQAQCVLQLRFSAATIGQQVLPPSFLWLQEHFFQISILTLRMHGTGLCFRVLLLQQGFVNRVFQGLRINSTGVGKKCEQMVNQARTPPSPPHLSIFRSSTFACFFKTSLLCF